MSISASTIPSVRRAPYTSGALITPSNATTFSPPYDGLICKGDGLGITALVYVDFADGGGTNVPVPVVWGFVMEGRVTKVRTGTTSTHVVGLRY